MLLYVLDTKDLSDDEIITHKILYTTRLNEIQILKCYILKKWNYADTIFLHYGGDRIVCIV